MNTISCDVCGATTDDSEIEIIPDERTVCGDCSRDWSHACELVVANHPELWAEVGKVFGDRE